MSLKIEKVTRYDHSSHYHHFNIRKQRDDYYKNLPKYIFYIRDNMSLNPTDISEYYDHRDLSEYKLFVKENEMFRVKKKYFPNLRFKTNCYFVKPIRSGSLIAYFSSKCYSYPDPEAGYVDDNIYVCECDNNNNIVKLKKIIYLEDINSKLRIFLKDEKITLIPTNIDYLDDKTIIINLYQKFFVRDLKVDIYELNYSLEEDKFISYKLKYIKDCKVLNMNKINEKWCYLCLDKNNNDIIFFDNKEILRTSLLKIGNKFIHENENKLNYVIFKNKDRYETLFVNRWKRSNNNLFPDSIRKKNFFLLCIIKIFSKKNLIQFNIDVIEIIFSYMINTYNDDKIKYNL